MPTPTEAVQATLAAATGVTALVSAEYILPPGNWQDIPRPYIVHYVISPEPTNTHGRRASLTFWQGQVSIFSDTYSSGEAVMRAVIPALEGNHDGFRITWQPGGGYLGMEPDTNVHNFALLFRIAEAL